MIWTTLVKLWTHRRQGLEYPAVTTFYTSANIAFNAYYNMSKSTGYTKVVLWTVCLPYSKWHFDNHWSFIWIANNSLSSWYIGPYPEKLWQVTLDFFQQVPHERPKKGSVVFWGIALCYSEAKWRKWSRKMWPIYFPSARAISYTRLLWLRLSLKLNPIVALLVFLHVSNQVYHYSET